MDAPLTSIMVYCEYSGLDLEGALVDRGFELGFPSDIPWQGPVLSSIMRMNGRRMRLITTASLRVYRIGYGGRDELVHEENLQRLFQPASV